MDFAAALEHLYTLTPELAAPRPLPDGTIPPRRKFDLAHMRALVAALGSPEKKVPSVLIAGTNGKGSTAATLASIVTRAGLRTGLYTSPHLIHVTERIQVSRGASLAPIANDDFARLYTRVHETAENLVQRGDLPFAPSFFERLTAVAFLYFSDKTDIMVLEVGLGGRLDATNVVEPLVSVITDIALDHQEWLGDTITSIAREKAGILRPHGTLVTLAQHPEANQAIGEVATALEVRGVNAGDFLPPAQRNNPQPLSFRSEAEEPASALPPRNRYTLHLTDSIQPGLLEVDSPLIGEHQRRNLALAIATAIELRTHHALRIPNEAIADGIRHTRWPGRLEWISPNLLLDVAHNPAGAWTLRAALSAMPQDRPRTLLFSCLSDKDLTEMSRILFPLFDSSTDGDPARCRDHIVLAPIASPRAAPVDDLLAAAHALGIPAHAAPHLAGALAQARSITPPDGLIIATGSVYLVGEIRQLVLQPEAISA